MESISKIHFKVILKFALIQLACLLILEILRPYHPTFIGSTPINISGLFLLILFSSISTFAFKSILNANSDTKILELLLNGILITFFAELIFKTGQFILTQIDIKSLLRAIILVPFLASTIQFCVAYQLKTKKLMTFLGYIFLAILVYSIVQVALKL
ncbi:MAG: hypothetical protein ACI80H_001764 [Pseudoalteromonas distincta]|jgi:hypothetical protein